MEKKVVLITGGSSGIGKAIGIYLSSKGYTVYGTTRNIENYSDFKHFTLLELDVRQPETIAAAVYQLVEKEQQLDVLINNAGIGITGAVEEIPHEAITATFDTNFNGPIHLMKAVFPQMRKQRKGLVINITSIAGHMGLPYRGIYSASKGALALLTEAIRMEVKDFGIQITNLAPGDFATNIAAGRYHAPVNPDSPYAETYKRVLDDIDADVSSGEHPEAVAIKVHQIIAMQGRAKVNYAVGAFMQKFSLCLKRILPNKVFERLMLNHYKL